MTRTQFLKEQTVSGANKCKRTPIGAMSVSEEPCSIIERKALALKKIAETMPVYIGPREMIVGTRTLLVAKEGNEDGHSIFEYRLHTKIPYLTQQEIDCFGEDQSYRNKTHYTPDFGIILHKGIDGIIRDAEERKKDPSLQKLNLDFLSAVVIAYKALKTLILRYEAEALQLAEAAVDADRKELLEIARICRKISSEKPETYREALQLLWFAHLGTMLESFEFINYGRLDVLLGEFLGDLSREAALQLTECLLLKMYDHADLNITYVGKYSAQLVVTLGGVLPNGENAVNAVTMLFLDAVDAVRLPEPELNLRISSKNPPEFLDRAAELSISGCNFISYYNDDLFVESLHRAGVPLEYARDYGFDLCQDINIPGRGDFYLCGKISLAHILMDLLQNKRDFKSYEDLIAEFKKTIALRIAASIDKFRAGEAQLDLLARGEYEEYFRRIRQEGKPIGRHGVTPMAPLPLLSALYHGSLEKALDMTYQPYPVKEKGLFFATVTEAINALAAIRKTVYEENRYTLEALWQACENNFSTQEELVIQNILWNCPKWGNDDDYVDSIAKEVLEFGLKECTKYKTYMGGQILGGIHQPHPVHTGKTLMATPEGRNAGTPVAVTLTPESGTMIKGPTAVLRSAAKLDPMLIQWNFCVMVNYFASAFRGNAGKENFKTLLNGYFQAGGLQYQPNITDVEDLKKAQLEPDNYKDLIVRLWGVSAHFVDLTRELQDEMIARFS